MKNKTVYLAGKISNDPQYKEKFSRAARELTAAGFVVINPAALPPEGFTYAAYIRISSAMLDECAAVCFLPDWKESRGAKHEYHRARLCGNGYFSSRNGSVGTGVIPLDKADYQVRDNHGLRRCPDPHFQPCCIRAARV